MSVETRETLLHGQLQEGLRYDIMRASSVSGAQSYIELCLAVKNEEKCLAELRKQRQYLKHARFDDWLPTLQRAATWNRLTDEEFLMQLAGHM